jgi:hypothetical protein
MAFGVLTVVVSAANPVATRVPAPATGTGKAAGWIVLGPDDVEGAIVAGLAGVALESARKRVATIGLEGGNSSCEIAITISERMRARKKRLSIQGTGS